MTTNERVRVLIVDDSAYMRKVVRQMLSRSPFLEVVGAARDGEDWRIRQERQGSRGAPGTIL